MSFINFDPHHYRYGSRRAVVYGTHGMVAASQPLAAQAGLEILKKGGNAVDAAIATAAALTVVEPTGCGLGSDAFAIVWKDGKLQGINGSGYAPASWSYESFKSRGWNEIPSTGWGASTVPGVVATWMELSKRMGRFHFTETLAPAIDYASRGYAVSPTMAYLWEQSFKKFSQIKGPEFNSWLKTFCPSGRAPKAGEIFRSQAHARTLRRIAETNGEDFYKGDIAEKIITFSRKTGGFFTPEDFSEFKPEWVEPISINYRGYDIWELPPNGQGICALIALNILKNFEFDAGTRDDSRTYHKQIEAIKMAFADAHRYVADMKFNSVPVKELLQDSYGTARSKLVDRSKALDFKPGDPKEGGTVFFVTADGGGSMVSYIQSNFNGFGSGVTVPETGIALNNRGCCFSFEPSHPNFIMGRKRPYNTIIPGFITKDGRPVGPFGVMGGFMQPQGHVQVVMNMIDFGMNPQEALDAPRWQWAGGMKVLLEPGFPENGAAELASMGHEIVKEESSVNFGRGEIILKTEYNSLAGATEPRTDGCVAVW